MIDQYIRKSISKNKLYKNNDLLNLKNSNI